MLDERRPERLLVRRLPCLDGLERDAHAVKHSGRQRGEDSEGE